MNQTILTPNTLVKTIFTIFFAPLFSIVALASAFIFIQTEKPTFTVDFKNIFVSIAVVAQFLGVFVSNYFPEKTKSRISRNLPLQRKMLKLQASYFIKYVALDFVAVLSVVFYFLENNLFFLMIAGILALYYLMQMPSKSRIIEEMQLTQEEKMEFFK